MTVDALIAKSESRLSLLRDIKDAILRRTAVTCFCGARHQVGFLVYIQAHWYVSPYGCTGGDYWNNGEGKWDCPDCGRRNRLYDKPEIMALKRLFASMRDCYCSDFSACSDPRPCRHCAEAGATKHGLMTPNRRT